MEYERNYYHHDYLHFFKTMASVSNFYSKNLAYINNPTILLNVHAQKLDNLPQVIKQIKADLSFELILSLKFKHYTLHPL